MRPFSPARCDRACLCAGATLVLTFALPAAALAANGATGTTHASVAHSTVPSFPIPASARMHGNNGRISPGATKTTPAIPSTTSTPPTTSIPASARVQPASPATSTVPASQAASRPTLPRNGLTAARSRSSAGGLHLSRAAWIAAAIAALLVLLSAAWSLARWLALQPRWTSSLAYSLEEASFKVSATWSEFLDWARIGR